KERSPRSRCHWVYAATTPLARLRVVSDAESAASQSPDSSAPSSAMVGASTLGAPGGAQSSHTTPPSWTTTAVCGPGAPQREQSWKLGAQPASDSALRR